MYRLCRRRRRRRRCCCCGLLWDVVVLRMNLVMDGFTHPLASHPDHTQGGGGEHATKVRGVCEEFEDLS